jgi:hypothetical protein
METLYKTRQTPSTPAASTDGDAWTISRTLWRYAGTSSLWRLPDLTATADWNALSDKLSYNYWHAGQASICLAFVP